MTVAHSYRFLSKLWRWPGDSAWHFVTVPKMVSEKIKKRVTVKRGWGSVRVRATIGETSWDTSIFPDTRGGTYLLPVKVSVRRAEGLDESDVVSVRIKTI